MIARHICDLYKGAVVEMCGSYRRGLDEIDFIDIVVTHTDLVGGTF